MAKRKGRKMQRRRSKPKLNLLNSAQTLLVANAVTTSVFGANALDFVTGRTNGRFTPSSDGGLRITLPELAGFSTNGWSASKVGGSYGSVGSFGNAVSQNLSANLVPLMVGVIGIPIAFKVGKQLAGKSLINPMNRGLKMVGLTGVKF
jgi:hypothetical protein